MGPFEEIIGKLTQTGATMRNPEKAINIFSLRDNILNNPNFEVFTETELAEKFKISKSEASKLIAATKKAFPNLGPILGTEKYPNVSQTLFKNIRMVANTISNYLQQNKINPKEARALLLSENMAELFPGREVAKDKVALKFYKWGPNSPERKVVFDSVKKQTGIDLTNEMYNNIVEETKKVRSESRQDARIFAKQKNINRDLVRLNKDVVLKNLLKQPFTAQINKAILRRAEQILKQEDIATVSRRLFMLGEALQGKTRNVQGIDFDPKIGDKIIETQQRFRNRYAFSNLVYDHYAKSVDNAFGNQRGKKFIPYYQKEIKKILNRGDSPDEIFSLRASGRRNMTPYAIFTQALKEDLNEKVKGARIDSSLGRTHRDIQEILKGRKFATVSAEDQKSIRDILKRHDNIVQDTLKEFPELKKYNVITSANFDFKNPPEKSVANFNQRFKDNPEIKKAFQDSYKKTGYSMKVPKNFLTQKEFLKKYGKSKGTTVKAQGLGPLFIAELPLYTMAEGKPFVETLDTLTFGAVNPVTYAAKKQANLSTGEKLAIQRQKNLDLLRNRIGDTTRQEMLGSKDPEYRALGPGKPSYLDFLIQKMEQPNYVGSLTSGQQKIETKADELRQKIMTPEKTEAAKTRYESFQKAFPVVPVVTNFLESILTGQKTDPYQKTLEQIQPSTYNPEQVYKKGGIVVLDEYKALRKKYGP